jgi:hypothetical protein
MPLRHVFRAILGVFTMSCLACSSPATTTQSGSSGAVPSASSVTPGDAALAPSASPPGSSMPVTNALDHATPVVPPALVDALVGCWEHPEANERWQLDRAGASGITVVRHVGAGTGDYEARAKIPTPLLHNAATGTLGFPAAGRIHALLFLFTRVDDHLEVDSFSRRQSSAPYHATGSHFTVHRCAAPPPKK